MMIVCRRESWDEVWPQVQPLLERHYREIALYQDIPLAVDVARYEQMENLDMLRIYVARSGSAIAGYCAMIVQMNAHYNTSKQAAQDVIYIDPAFRRGRVALRLLQFVEQELKREGVQVVYQHSKFAHPALTRLLDFMGYTRSDILHSKRLD